MTGLLLSMFLTTSYHEAQTYEPMQYEVIRQLSILAIGTLDYSGCSPITNYYGDADYFAFENLCPVEFGLHKTKLRYITIIDIEAMEFFRVNESQF